MWPLSFKTNSRGGVLIHGLEEIQSAGGPTKVFGEAIPSLKTSQSRNKEKKAPHDQKGSPKLNLSKHTRMKVNLILNLLELMKLCVLNAREEDTLPINARIEESWC